MVFEPFHTAIIKFIKQVMYLYALWRQNQPRSLAESDQAL